MSQAVALQSERTLDAATFFESMLPAILAERSELAASMRGSICIIVHGAGNWVITLGRDAEVKPDLDLDADLVVTFSVAGFAALMAGEALDPDSSEPICMGDESLLDKLGRLIVAPSQGAVAARLMSI